MSRAEDQATFWEQLYTPPKDGGGAGAGRAALEFDEHDLVAEILGGDGGENKPKTQGAVAGPAANTPAALEDALRQLLASEAGLALLEPMLKRMGVGQVSSPPAAAPEPTRTTSPAPSAPAPTPTEASQPRSGAMAPAPSSPTSLPNLRAIGPAATSNATLRAVPPAAPTPAVEAPKPRPAFAAALAGRATPPPPAAPTTPESRTPVAPTASPPSRPAAPPALPLDLKGYWQHRAVLPGGIDSIATAHLGQVARSVLVLVDGELDLERLKSLQPTLSQIEFALVVRDAVKRGLLVLEG